MALQLKELPFLAAALALAALLAAPAARADMGPPCAWVYALQQNGQDVEVYYKSGSNCADELVDIHRRNSDNELELIEASVSIDDAIECHEIPGGPDGTECSPAGLFSVTDTCVPPDTYRYYIKDNAYYYDIVLDIDVTDTGDSCLDEEDCQCSTPGAPRVAGHGTSFLSILVLLVG
jgi:hypothetical protein